jgi:hypothetical protein
MTDGRTHHADCYDQRGHHECAVREVERLRGELLRQSHDEKSMTCDALRKLVEKFRLWGKQPGNGEYFIGYEAACEACAAALEAALAAGENLEFCPKCHERIKGGVLAALDRETVARAFYELMRKEHGIRETWEQLTAEQSDTWLEEADRFLAALAEARKP